MYASLIDNVDELLSKDWLNENLPEFLKVCINLYNEINWNKERPLSFNNAKLAIVNGNVNKNLPAIANKTAKIIKPININILTLLDIFLS